MAKRIPGGRPFFGLKMDPEDANRLELVRQKLGLTRSEVMRQALRSYLDKVGTEEALKAS